MSAAVYSAHGPVTGQDGRPAWAVVRTLEGCSRLLAVAEASTAQLAWEHARALNDAAQKADAMSTRHDTPARGPRPAFLPTEWPFPLPASTTALLRRAPRRRGAPAGEDAPF